MKTVSARYESLLFPRLSWRVCGFNGPGNGMRGIDIWTTQVYIRDFVDVVRPEEAKSS